MPNRTAVVFDLDGTLTDTEETWDIVRRGLAREDGVPWPDGATHAMMGMSTGEWSAYLADVVGLTGTAAELAARTIDGVAEYHRRHLPVLPGAVAAVRRMAARGPLGLASSSPRRLIDLMLQTMGVAELFSVTRSTEEGEGRGKPAPDAYLWVCDHLGVHPSAAVAIEDSANGLRSAHAAGMKLIAIPPLFHPPPPDALALADVVLSSLDQVTVDVVERLLADGSRPST